MNNEDKDWEKHNLEILPQGMQTIFSDQNMDLPDDEDVFLQPKYSTNQKKMNLSHGEASCCIDSLVSHKDLQSARE